MLTAVSFDLPGIPNKLRVCHLGFALIDRPDDHPECLNEYDRYARTICRYLLEGIDEFRLAAYLTQVQSVAVGLPPIDMEQDRSVARPLLGLPYCSSSQCRPRWIARTRSSLIVRIFVVHLRVTAIGTLPQCDP